MRTRVSTVLVFLLVMPTLMGCFGEDSKPPAEVEPPFGFEEAIPSGVWYHIGGSPSNQNVTDILNESAMKDRGFSMDMFNGSNVPYWANGTYYGTGYDTFEPTIGILSDGTIVFTNWGGTGTGTMIIRSQDQGQTWENVGPFGQVYPAGQVPNSNDPYIYVDPWTDRIVKFDMHALVSMYVEYSDDSGDSWSPPFTAYGYYTPQDHQSIASTLDVNDMGTYDTIYVYCINTGNSALGPQCSRSFDGGHTWDLQQPGSPLTTQCSGLHGHVVGSIDGWVYRGNPSCEGPAVYASDDGGYSWSENTITTEVGMQQGWHSHEVATATDAAGNLYGMWIGDGMMPWVSWSTDHGATWREPIMVAAPGLEETGFPTIHAGADGRVAFAYIGEFTDNGGWGGFMGVVTDANATYPLITTTMVNEFGDMLDMTDDCGDVRCGGFGDFIDIEIDDQGRPWVALAHNVHNEEAIIGTWTTGPSLFGDNITMLDVLPAGGNSTLKM